MKDNVLRTSIECLNVLDDLHNRIRREQINLNMITSLFNIAVTGCDCDNGIGLYGALTNVTTDEVDDVIFYGNKILTNNHNEMSEVLLNRITKRLTDIKISYILLTNIRRNMMDRYILECNDCEK